MIKLLLSLILMLGFSFGANDDASVDSYYSELDKEEVILSAYEGGKEDKRSPLRKRSHKRKRRWRHPDIGK